jgi:uncharacterized membrane protein
MAIQSPPGWILQQVQNAGTVVAADTDAPSDTPVIQRIGIADLKSALKLGYDDFQANRTDVLFLCVIYPVLGLFFGRIASGYGLVSMLFPLASGFALIGPFAAVGLNDMSRRRERGETVVWTDAFGVLRRPAIGSIILLGLLLGFLLVLWLQVAQLIANATIGPALPDGVADFVRLVLATPEGWAMIIAGMGVGLLFAILVLSISVVAFPLLLDRNVGVGLAVQTSLAAVRANPWPMAVWGLMVAGLLVLGSIPVFLGLVVVMPVLGHATWHLYRAVVR